MSGMVKKKLRGIIVPDKDNRIARMQALAERLAAEMDTEEAA